MIKISLIWLGYCLKWMFGKRRFLAATLPFVKLQYIYDRKNRKWLKIFIRDSDDWIQLEHIFLNEEFNLSKTARQLQINELHQRILANHATPLILDLGANIGLASKYFSWVYPDSMILAVEPDTGNCQIARQNLPADALLFPAAISSQEGSAALIDTGRNCGFRVESNGHGGVRLMTVPKLLESVSGCIPFLIKIDIEGFESDLFSKNTDWIDLFPIMLIELHDWMLPNSRVTKNFLNEIAKRDREFMHFDGYIVSVSNNLTKIDLV